MAWLKDQIAAGRAEQAARVAGAAARDDSGEGYLKRRVREEKVAGRSGPVDAPVPSPGAEAGPVSQAPTADEYEAMPKDVLVGLAEKRGLAHSGSKADLAERLVEYDAAEA